MNDSERGAKRYEKRLRLHKINEGIDTRVENS